MNVRGIAICIRPIAESSRMTRDYVRWIDRTAKKARRRTEEVLRCIAARWSSSTWAYGTVHTQGLIGTIPYGLSCFSFSLWGGWIDPAPPQVRSARAWLGWAEWAGLGGMRAWEASSAAEEDGLTAESHLRRGDMITRVFLEMLWIRHARARLRF